MANLIDKVIITKDLKAVANTIRKGDEYAAQRLEDLSLAVSNGIDENIWAASNIYQIIEPNDIITSYQNQHVTDKFLSWLELVRNVLIFAPLVVTWYGVSQAVDSYHQLISADRAQQQTPFLYLWQDGFGHRLPDYLKLSSLAIADFGILAAVFLLTFGVYFISNIAKSRHERDAEDLRSKLTHALSGATLYLQTKNQQQPTGIIAQFEESRKQFAATITELLARITTLATLQEQSIQTFVQFKSDLSTNMSSMSNSAADMKNSTGALQRSIAELLTPTRTLATQQTALVGSIQSAVTLFKEQIAAQAEVIKEQKSSGATLNQVLTSLKTTVDQGKIAAKEMGEFTNRQAGLVTAQTGLVAAMERERDELAKLANNVYTASESLTKFVAETAHFSRELNAINVNMDQIVRRLAALAAGRP